MKIYKHRVFAKWAKKEGLLDRALQDAIEEITAGLFDADLRSNLYKKRIARKGKGKRGGYRTLVAFKQDDKAVFIFGFAKNTLENIDGKELQTFKKLAEQYLLLTPKELAEAVKENKFIEVL